MGSEAATNATFSLSRNTGVGPEVESCFLSLYALGIRTEPRVCETDIPPLSCVLGFGRELLSFRWSGRANPALAVSPAITGCSDALCLPAPLHLIMQSATSSFWNPLSLSSPALLNTQLHTRSDLRCQSGNIAAHGDFVNCCGVTDGRIAPGFVPVVGYFGKQWCQHFACMEQGLVSILCFPKVYIWGWNTRWLTPRLPFDCCAFAQNFLYGVRFTCNWEGSLLDGLCISFSFFFFIYLVCVCVLTENGTEEIKLDAKALNYAFS